LDKAVERALKAAGIKVLAYDTPLQRWRLALDPARFAEHRQINREMIGRAHRHHFQASSPGAR
jgi:hypothetical protein